MNMKFLFAFLGFTSSLLALPSGGTVVTPGSAAIVTDSNGQSVSVNTVAPQTVINWNSFSLASGEQITFSTNNNAGNGTFYVLNKVTGGSASTINGTIWGAGDNAYIYLINTNGILIGSSANIVSANFLASTLDVVGTFDPTKNMTFAASSSGNGSLVVNASSNINQVYATNGEIIFIAPSMTINGQINASKIVAYGVGSNILYQPSSAERIFINATGPAGTGTGLTLGGTTTAEQVYAKADGNMYTLAINQTGIINVSGCLANEGVVKLIADPRSTGVGSIAVQGTIQRNLTKGTGPNIEIHGHTIALLSPAVINTTGASGGGNLIIGSALTYLANNVYIAPGVTITGNATSTGSALNVNIYGTQSLLYEGAITATGAAAASGGTVAMASAGYLGMDGTVNLTASNGSTGTFTGTSGINILVGAAANYGTNFQYPNYTIATVPSVFTQTNLQNSLNTSNVAVVAQGVSSVIQVTNPITWTVGNALSLTSSNDLFINRDIHMTAVTLPTTSVINLHAPNIVLGLIGQTQINSAVVHANTGTINVIADPLSIYGGAILGADSAIITDSGTVNITLASELDVIGGTTAAAYVKGSTVNITAPLNTFITSGDCSSAYINGSTVNFTGTNLTITGSSCGDSHDAYLGNSQGPSTINLNLGTGTLTLNGGSGGSNNYASIISNSSTGNVITINAGNVIMQAGNAGTTNFSRIAEFGNAGTINMVLSGALNMTGGGAASVEAETYIRANLVNITTGGNLTMTGGAGLFSTTYIYGPSGVNLNVGGNLSVSGGSNISAHADIIIDNGDFSFINPNGQGTFSLNAGSDSRSTVTVKNGNIGITSKNINITGGLSGTENHAAIEVLSTGNILIVAGQNIAVQGGQGGSKPLGYIANNSGNTTIQSGLDITITTGTTSLADAAISNLHGVLSVSAARDLILQGTCGLNTAYLRTKGSGTTMNAHAGRTILQRGSSVIGVTPNSNSTLNITFGTSHVILDCSFVTGDFDYCPYNSLSCVRNYPRVDDTQYYLLYEVFYRLNYFTFLDWRLTNPCYSCDPCSPCYDPCSPCMPTRLWDSLDYISP